MKGKKKLTITGLQRKVDITCQTGTIADLEKLGTQLLSLKGSKYHNQAADMADKVLLRKLALQRQARKPKTGIVSRLLSRAKRS